MDPTPIANQPTPPTSGDASARASEVRLTAISSLLTGLDEAAATPAAQRHVGHENQLVQVRLGVASALFAALRTKHPATAAHSLRVAMGCSAFGLSLGLDEAQCDELEVAALLHDVGKIGVPDEVLLKPAALAPDEAEIMQRHRWQGLQILGACCASPSLLDSVRYAPAWYSGHHDFDLAGENLPLGSRMIAIVDAFDSMTTDHVYRRALSRERAVGELFDGAGTQFDPRLVREYCQLQLGDQARLQARVARRWLQQLDPEESNQLWQLQHSQWVTHPAKSGVAFHQALVDNMHDAVIFIDPTLQITLWNHGAQRLTGITSSSVVGRRWLPRLIELLDDRGLVISDTECPVARVLRDGQQMLRRFTITGRNGKETNVNVHIMPIAGEHGATVGAAMLLHDVSSEKTLEQQIQNLAERATQDALTKVANRAEFDRTLVKFIETHLKRNVPCALVLCDIDHFKKINDTYGHQAGDEALVSFAAILKRSCRPGDIVARYGGEEFAILCADCDNAAATLRAEKIRREVAAATHEVLGGTTFSASFGVTEVQQGDNPETMLRRADRALYEAKEMGRNMVVQLGSGLSGQAESRKPWWHSWFGGEKVDQLIEARLVATVPLKMVVEKLRGFVADQEAEISSIEEDHVVLSMDGSALPQRRRSSDRAVPLTIELKFTERNLAGAVRTYIDVVLRPRRGRDRRKRDSVERARQALSSLKSYLMACDVADLGDDEPANVRV
jgi:diguanylate cyclase (GGDEF)-like protein/PAS domain S-box-containing protein